MKALDLGRSVELTVKRYYYQSHDRLKRHLHAFLTACNFAKRLKTSRD